MKRTMIRAGRLTIGSVLILAGIVSGFIPVLQGWVFILAGLTIMAPESRHAHAAMVWIKDHLRRRKSPGGALGDD